MAIALNRQQQDFRPIRQQRACVNALHGDDRNGKLIAVGNLKGGTGKSTLTVNLAGMMAAEGNKVCIADCDPQATSSSWLAKGHIRVVPEIMPLNEVGDVVDWLNKARELSKRFDIVIIDLPSVLSPAMGSAFLLSHLLLIPVSPSTIDLHGTRRVMRHVRTVREERLKAKPTVMLVPTRVPEDQLAQSTLDQIFNEFPEKVGPPLRERRAFYEAFTARRWVGDIAPEDTAHADICVLHAAVMEQLNSAPQPPLLTRPILPARPPRPDFPANDQGHYVPTRKVAKKSWLRRIFGI